MEKAALKTYQASSDAARIYRDSAGMNVADLNITAVTGNFADLMKNNIVVSMEMNLVEMPQFTIEIEEV
jgi:hypothetical protein